MKIVIAPDSFKESLSSRQVAEAIAEGLGAVLAGANLELIPLADGGEGTVDALVTATGGRRCEAVVRGPLGDPVSAAYGILGDGRTAVVEVASASGLAHLPANARDPMRTSSYGCGELIQHALSHPVERVVMGLGGSASNDGGLGAAMLSVLNAEIRSGIDVVMDIVDLNARLASADVVITAEGRIDSQTLRGKTPFGVAKLAATHDIPVVALGASLADEAEAVGADVFDFLEAVVTRPLRLHERLSDARPVVC